MEQLNLIVRREVESPLALQAVPTEAPVPMPVQSLEHWTPPAVADGGELRSGLAWRRALVLCGALALTAGAAYAMFEVLAVSQITALQIVLLVLFVANFAWIALWFMNGVHGFLSLWRGRSTIELPKPTRTLSGRTVLVFPVYNEAAKRVFASIQAMWEDLEARGTRHAFDFFILSDSTDVGAWLAEESSFRELRHRLGEDARIYYRHRPRNTARKSGNIAEFCRRWGGRYDFMVVLDADSLMTAEALVRLAAAMERHPEAGIIQSAPKIVGGRTLFARAQQFASHVYGPLVASGLAFWSGGSGNYWGHNAIIRMRAFTGHAGLPELGGRPPLGGHILSHDFVEAALMRRGGWKVYMAPQIEGSYEECPPSLIDYVVRDRRWCQGNLQHLTVLRARGLTWLSRLHLLLGVISYLASPLWLSFLLIGVLLALQSRFVRPEYFPEGFALFPTWPTVNAELAAWLFAGTMVVLLAPRLLGLLLHWRDRRTVARFGGRLASVVSMVLEVVFSALTAPVLMVAQSQAVFAILSGRDSGWHAQCRDGDEPGFGELFSRHRGHLIAGLLLAGLTYAVSPPLLAWMSPVVLGLLLAHPLSAAGASRKLGLALRRRGLLVTPPESDPPRLLARAAELRRSLEEPATAAADAIKRVIADPELRALHLALLQSSAPSPSHEIDVDLLVALAKLDRAGALAQAIEALSAKEAFAAMNNAVAVERLVQLEEKAATLSIPPLRPERAAGHGFPLGVISA